VIADPERAEGYRKQLEALLPSIAAKRKLLAERSARMDRLESERKAAQSAFTSSETRAQEVRSARGYRGERLRIIDPGIRARAAIISEHSSQCRDRLAELPWRFRCSISFSR
jgi:uncharacterized protein involved in exopolysaccharide biosynthesis